MATVPYANQPIANLPSSWNHAQKDDFFGYGNAMQAIGAIAPQQTDGNGVVQQQQQQQPTQIITVSGGGISHDQALSMPGGSFFDLRSADEIFADMDMKLNRQRQQILNTPHLWEMLDKKAIK